MLRIMQAIKIRVEQNADTDLKSGQALHRVTAGLKKNL